MGKRKAGKYKKKETSPSKKRPISADVDHDIEFYKQVEQKHATKLAAKADIYSRPTKAPKEPEALVDGKRPISYQIEKNRGLTPRRKKQNSRTTYRKKHKNAVEKWKGQVKSMRKESGPYGGLVGKLLVLTQELVEVLGSRTEFCQHCMLPFDYLIILSLT